MYELQNIFFFSKQKLKDKQNWWSNMFQQAIFAHMIIFYTGNPFCEKCIKNINVNGFRQSMFAVNKLKESLNFL